MLDRLSELLPQTGDPDGRSIICSGFIASSRSPQALGGLFDRDPRFPPTLLRIFSVSQYLADQLINDPDCFDMLRMTEGQGVSREVLCDEVLNEILACSNEAAVLRSFAISVIVKRCESPLATLSDCRRRDDHRTELDTGGGIVRSCLSIRLKSCSARYGTPMTPQSVAARFSVIALGKLGGNELNYSSDIDLMYIAETDGKTEGGKSIANQEFFDRLAQAMTRYLSEVTANGRAYRVDLRLRPYGKSGPMVSSLESALNYYEASGRTWERQAFIKGRCVRGHGLWPAVLGSNATWIFRRYLTAADISGIKA